MTHHWILDVLADLKTYARDNDLGVLAEQLDDTQHVAAVELAARAGALRPMMVNGGAPETADDAGQTRGAL